MLDPASKRLSAAASPHPFANERSAPWPLSGNAAVPRGERVRGRPVTPRRRRHSSRFNIEGEVAFITGGSRGIGYMMARDDVETGARVYVAASIGERCGAAAVELSVYGERHALPADLATFDAIDDAAVRLAEREDSLHIRVNNDGTGWGESIARFPAKGRDKVVALNLESPFFLLQRLLPLLVNAARTDAPEQVINLVSVDSMHLPPCGNCSYAVVSVSCCRWTAD
ncbi:MAG: SDR family NAD(P)-dependent oxidoreductase [Gammaproteobacteria bacterium]